MEGPTQVQAVAWVDAQGTLRESSSFRTGMQVRGIRVLSYMRDSQGQPNADVSWQEEPGKPQATTASAAAEPAKAEPACAAGSHQETLKHLIDLRISYGSGWPADDLPLLQSLEAVLRDQWRLASASAQIWRMTPATDNNASAYEKALLGTHSSQASLQATLLLSPVASPLRSLPAGSPTAMQLSLVMTQGQQLKPVLDDKAQIKVGAVRQNWAAPRLSEEARSLVAEQVQAWSEQLQQRLACESVLPEVIFADKQEIRINAGTLAGVRLGDEWMLADSKQFPQQLLEPGVATQTVLARVAAVNKHQAQLKLIAGPTAAVQAHWRAWPSETTH